MDQLNLEKKGIPTVTITTNAFEEMLKTTVQEQGASDLCAVIVEHPIAGHNLKDIRKKGESDFPAILKAATQWQPKQS